MELRFIIFFFKGNDAWKNIDKKILFVYFNAFFNHKQVRVILKHHLIFGPIQ